jgi:2-succinyl-5-enolpyruvyl-6-hydroxy-3-cyclohexene-1-carboxylate synthase
VVLLVGDLSFYHDLNGLLAARRFALSLTIVVVNNDGGGIFSFLPQAELLDRAMFERLFGTPLGFDVGAAARLYGLAHARPGNWPEFRRELCRGIGSTGTSVVELVTDRERNVVQHRAVWPAVTGAVRPLVESG